MDRQNSSVPDHDPVASGSGARYRSIAPAPIPIPDSADVPEVMLQRYAEADALMADVERLAASQRQAGALDMALRVARALRADLGPEVLGTLRRLEYMPGSVPEVLVALDQLTGQAPEDGGS